MAQEGAIQVFEQKDIGIESFIVGVVGVLQLEVLEYRLINEYSAQLLMNQLAYTVARWFMRKIKSLLIILKDWIAVCLYMTKKTDLLFLLITNGH